MNAVGHFLFSTTVGRTMVGYVLMWVVPLLLPIVFVRLVGLQGLRHLFSYETHISPIHRLDPRLKVLYPVVIGILTVMLSWQFVFGLLALTLVPWVILRPSRERLPVLLTMTCVPAMGMIWSQGLFHPVGSGAGVLFAFPDTIRWFGTQGLTGYGLLFGAEQAGRMLVTVSASLLLLLTTTPSEMIWAFYKFRLPAQAGFAFTVALRFLPSLLERMTQLLKAMEVRGYDLSRPRVWQVHRYPAYVQRICVAIPLVTVPLLIGSLRSTSVMAMVADARAFGAKPTRTMMDEHTVRGADRCGWAALTLLVVTVVAMLSLHIGVRETYR